MSNQPIDAAPNVMIIINGKTLQFTNKQGHN